jgi:hypothetical protein
MEAKIRRRRRDYLSITTTTSYGAWLSVAKTQSGSLSVDFRREA